MPQSRTVERLFRCSADRGQFILTHFTAFNPESIVQGWRNFLSALAQIVYFNFEEILSRAHGNFKEQKNVLESSIIVINYLLLLLLLLSLLSSSSIHSIIM